MQNNTNFTLLQNFRSSKLKKLIMMKNFTEMLNKVYSFYTLEPI